MLKWAKTNCHVTGKLMTVYESIDNKQIIDSDNF